jgi:hypothetical protein
VTNFRVARHPASRWRYCHGGVVVMAAAAAEPIFLEAPGDVIWRLLETPRTVREMADELRRQFAGDPATIARDLEAFVAELAVAGLVEQ